MRVNYFCPITNILRRWQVPELRYSGFGLNEFRMAWERLLQK